jgi:hypothetical protein
MSIMVDVMLVERAERDGKVGLEYVLFDSIGERYSTDVAPAS